MEAWAAQINRQQRDRPGGDGGGGGGGGGGAWRARAYPQFADRPLAELQAMAGGYLHQQPVWPDAPAFLQAAEAAGGGGGGGGGNGHRCAPRAPRTLRHGPDSPRGAPWP